MNNFLSDHGSRFPTGKSSDDRGDVPIGANKLGSTVKAISDSTSAKEEIQANPNGSWPLTDLPRDAQSYYPKAAQIFAYGAISPACDADCQDEELRE